MGGFIAGLIFVGLLSLLRAGLRAFSGFDFYWPIAALCGIWAAHDTADNQMQRFERVFPLDPWGLFFAVLFAWPFAFPWYLSLKDRAFAGKLQPPTGPSRLKYVLIVIAVVGGVAFQFWLSRSPIMNAARGVARSVQAASAAPVDIHLLTSGVLTITVSNSPIAVNEPAARAAEALRLARVAAKAMPAKVTFRTVRVHFVHVRDPDYEAVLVSDEAYEWQAEDLLRDAGQT